MPFYLLAAFILIMNSVVLYTFHLFLAMRLNKGVTIIAGILESIIAALFLTGLGDKIWVYMPCAWASRFITNMISVSTGEQAFDTGCILVVLLCVTTTLGALWLYGVWACRWEGQHTME